MKKTVFLYCALLAILAILLRVLEYRFFVRELSIEIYVGLVAVLFSLLGIWVGLKIVNRRHNTARFQESLQDIVIDPEKLRSYGISDRELDVLQLMARGYSNQEIADKLFVSLHTIKTHCSNLYSKLDVKRRTQAIQKAREMSAVT